MNNAFIGRVNQRIAFARQQLSFIDDLSSTQMRNQSCAYAAIWHLNIAYRAYIAEVGANYKLEKPEQPSNAQELSSALELLNKDPAEARELAILERRGFIADLQKALKQIELIEEGLVALAPDKIAEFDPLSLKDITETEEKINITAQLLSDWINEFKNLINRHRELMIEC